MSAGEVHADGRIIPLCRTCRNEATEVLAYENGDALPFCAMCANTAYESAYDNGRLVREYPIEEYYPPDDDRICQFDPHDEPEFELFSEHNDDVWAVAYNSVKPGSSVDVVEWC